jgi:hypothetical protein
MCTTMPGKIMKKIKVSHKGPARIERKSSNSGRAWEAPYGVDAPLLSNSTLEEILRAVDVPEEYQPFARRLIQMSVDEAFALFMFPSKYKIPRAPLRQIARLSEELAERLDQLREGVATLERFFERNRGPRPSTGALRRLTLELRRLSKDANLAALPPLKKKDAHRPRFSVQNPPYHVLVHSLYRGIVEEAHGEFAVRKSSITGELQGAAPAVLKLLQPFLPEIIPAKLSYSTLRRMLLAAAAESLELHRLMSER